MVAGRKSQDVGCVLMIIVGIALYLFGAITLGAYGSRLRCTKTVHATVVRNQEFKTVRNGTVRNARRDIKYAPVFEYEYDGERYTHVSTVTTDSPQYYEFEQVTIRINPNDPEEIRYEPKGIYKVMTTGAEFLGGTLVLGGVGILIISKTKPPKQTLG